MEGEKDEWAADTPWSRCSLARRKRLDDLLFLGLYCCLLSRMN